MHRSWLLASSLLLASGCTPPADSSSSSADTSGDYLETNAKAPGVKTTASGLQYKVLVAAEGASPKASDKVRVHYEGKLTNGQVFDSSIARGEPITFPLTGVIQGWIEGLQLMQVGSTYELVIPYTLAYGEAGRPPRIPPRATLIFKIQLLAIE
jgi:FKBP-type peptidyl-prolyl cis-trans isomerase FklB